MKRLLKSSPLALAGIGGAVVLIGATAAFAAWGVTSEEFSFTNTAATLSKGNRPDVSAKANTVTVSWIPTKVVGSTTVEGYRIKRYDDADLAQDPSGACETLVVQANCTDAMVPVGSWRYTVVPVQGTWAGPESARSARVTVHPDRSVTVEPIPDPSPSSTTTPPSSSSTSSPLPTPPGESAPDGTVTPPAWTVDVGADSVLSAGDTLTLAGSEPGAFVAGWDGAARPVTVAARAGDPDTLTVTDDAVAAAKIGPLAIGTQYVGADATFPGRMVAVDGRFVITLDAAPETHAPPAETPPADDPPAPAETASTPAEEPSESEEAPAVVETTAGAGADADPTTEATTPDAVTASPSDVSDSASP